MAQPQWQGFVSERGIQIGKQAGRCSVEHAIAEGASAHSDGLNEVAFANPRLADKNQVRLTANEVAGSQFLDL